ncbi:MAG: Ig-like domain-containing protein, partial [Gemmatimonadales bacterium]|nr:Ig-like domain-containing protein [Gemmatimonadales bacterium]
MKRSIAVLTLVAVVAGCGSDPVTPPGPFMLALNAGNGQTGTVGAALGAPLSVLVTNADGPVAGVRVRWSVTSGGGSVPPTSETGADGVAAATYTLGTTAGTKAVTATVGGGDSAVTFSATALPGPARRLVRNSGDGQSVFAGQAAASPLAAVVLDQYNNGVPGVTVTWSVTLGGGSVAPAAAMTDSTGIATTSFTAGPALGGQ